jgi:hypothetical protein
MDVIHAALALVTAVGAAAGVLAGAWALATRSSGILWLDRFLLVVLAAAALAGLVGLLLLVTGGHPQDPLHIVYGVLVVAIVPATRYVSRGWTERRQAAALAVAFLVSIGVLWRLLMTGPS